MRKVLAILTCTVFALTGCSIENGNQRPDEKKLRDGIKLILTYMERSHPDLINWEKSAVSNQINKKLPVGYATDAGWTIKWSNPITGELPQVIVPWDLLGQFPTKTNLDVAVAETAGTTELVTGLIAIFFIISCKSNILNLILLGIEGNL